MPTLQIIVMFIDAHLLNKLVYQFALDGLQIQKEQKAKGKKP